jgi:phospholipid/cholesterol/gamma-HCH transport system permease protein
MAEAEAADLLSRLGERTLAFFEEAGEHGLLAWESLRSGWRHGWPVAETVRQLDQMAVRSLALVAVTSLFTGMVLSLQTAFALSRFGAKPYVGSIVGLAIVRELGPVLAALMFGGRVGAGIASELGSMKVTEQIDAIRAMGADPLQKLVLPRILAGTFGLPALTVFAIVLGVFGGGLVADLQYGITPSFYLQTIRTIVGPADFLSGVAKTVVFGFGIALVGCHVGITTTGGTAGVGRATTRAVVIASIGVLVSDFFLTKLLLLLPTDALLRGLVGLFR